MSTVIEVLLSALEEEKIQYIFGVPGGPLVPLYQTMDGRKTIKPILAKHEAGAAFMADGYARVRRGLGVCVATTGPGVTNALTGVASAQSDSIPLLLISAQVATSAFGRGAVQDSSGGHWQLNSVDLFTSATKWSSMLQHPQQSYHQIRRALRTALTGRPGAVHLSIPADVMNQMVLAPQEKERAFQAYRSYARPAGDQQLLNALACALLAARNPVFLVGHGIHLAQAWEPLQRVAEALSIPVATTLKGKGAFPEQHELSLGVFGMGGGPFAHTYLLEQNIDVIVFIGTSLGEFQTAGWDARLTSQRTVIQIDIDPLEIGKNYPVDIGIVADANLCLTSLADRLVLPQGMIYRESHQLAKQQHQQHSNAQMLQCNHPILKPQAVIAYLNEIVPPETLLFVDNGNSFSWVGQFYQARQPGTIFFATGFASMGYAAAAPIGGKLAAPDRPVVAILGDAAFCMNAMEIHTAVEYQVPVIWVVLNNGGHGMVHHGETLLYGQSYEALFHRPLDIARIAQSLGAWAFQIRTLDEFRQRMEQALSGRHPMVLDVIIDLEEIPFALRQRVSTLNTFFTSSSVQEGSYSR